MERIFYEIIEEAKNGKINIDGEEWPIAFNTIIYDNEKEETKLFNRHNLSTLEIKDKELFFKELESYINLEQLINRKGFNNNVKLLISYLFINATTEDFSNPINLIRRNINFLKDKTFENFNKIIETNEEYKIKINSVSQNIFMETPNKMEISIIYNNNEYKLPTISYGITCNENVEKECFIYSILNPKTKKDLTEEEIKFNKKVSRLLYKINGGINEEDEIKEVSPSAVLSLLLFFNILEQYKIYNIKAVPYLPLRYLSRDIAANNIDNKEKSKELNSRNNFIQNNITNKFLNTFFRVIYHMKDANVVSYPYEIDEFLSINLKDSKVINNNFLENITSSLNK